MSELQVQNMDVANMSEEQLQELWEQAKPGRSRFEFNKIFVDHSNGKVFAVKNGQQEEIDIKNAEFTFLMKRVHIRSEFNPKLGDNGMSEYRVEETDDLSQIHIRDHEGNDLGIKNFFDVKDEYKLKTQEVFYVEYNGDLYRWVMSVGGYTVVRDLLKKINKHQKPVKFKIDSVESQKVGSNTSYKLSFSISGDADMKVWAEHFKALQDFLKNYYAEKKEQEQGESIVDEEDSIVEDIKKSKKKDEVKPEDLPF